MSPSLILAFNIEQKVTIKDLEYHGTVKAIYISDRGVQYQVRYFYNGEAKEVYFFANELGHRL